MDLKIRLTPRQKEIVDLGRIKGYVSLRDIRKLYSAQKTAIDVIKRLVDLRFFMVTESHGIFRYTGDDYQRQLNQEISNDLNPR